jgi:hypothetical protein
MGRYPLAALGLKITCVLLVPSAKQVVTYRDGQAVSRPSQAMKSSQPAGTSDNCPTRKTVAAQGFPPISCSIQRASSTPDKGEVLVTDPHLALAPESESPWGLVLAPESESPWGLALAPAPRLEMGSP